MSNQVANTILEQIGGRQFIVMTGAKNFLAAHDSLSFRIPNDLETKNGANTVRVTLAADDTYTVKFLKVRGTSIRTISETPMIYADMLRGFFESETGLATSLTRRFAA